jgi:protein phosphatase
MGVGGDPEAKETAEFVRIGGRSSEFFETEPRDRVRVEVGARTHPGAVRPNNEDNYLVVRRYRGREVLLTSLPREILDAPEDEAYTLLVADGMGGTRFGELASLLAVMAGWELGGREVKWPMKMNAQEAGEVEEKARAYFRRIDQAIHAEARGSPRLAGMGTTLTICYSTGPELFVLHAGDSRAYLHRAGVLHRLTRDHNLAQVLIDSGAAQPGSAEVRGMRHVLTNVLGGPTNTVDVEFHHQRLADGDYVLLCTDGLTDVVADDEIARLLDGRPAPPEACGVLVDLALQRRAKDNVTVILARYQISEMDGVGSSEARRESPPTGSG